MKTLGDDVTRNGVDVIKLSIFYNYTFNLVKMLSDKLNVLLKLRKITDVTRIRRHTCDDTQYS